MCYENKWCHHQHNNNQTLKCAQLGVEHFDLQVSYRKWALGFAVPCINVLNSRVGNIKSFSFHVNLKTAAVFQMVK